MEGEALQIAAKVASQVAAKVASQVVVAVFLSTVANRLVEGLIRPVWLRFKLDKLWLMYIAWGVAGLLVFLGRVNLLADVIPDPLTGQILTALVCGGGANLIRDLFGQSKPVDTYGGRG
jgi:hypothetical protein